MGQYLTVGDISVSTCGSSICRDIKAVFKAGKNAWTSNLKWFKFVVCDSLISD